MNYDALNSMCSWERKKALFLIDVADELGMDTDGYGAIGVNEYSGYTYLWLEEYPFTLYMDINCDLKINDVWAIVSNPEDGEEYEFQPQKFTLDELLRITIKKLKEWESGK